MQIVEKPYLLKVPQLGHVVLAGRRARVLMAASGVVGMVKSGWGGCFGQEVYGMSIPYEWIIAVLLPIATTPVFVL